MKVVLVGAGGMGKAWLGTILANPSVELVGVVDLDLEMARSALGAAGVPDVAVGTDVVEVSTRVSAEAVIDVTVPQAHHPVTTAALFAGFPVLGEKPVAPTVAQALSLVAAAEVTGVPFVVSQSRRYNPHVEQFREQTRVLGTLGSLSTEFFKAPHFGGFREEMDQPLLVDMAIHQFDLARYLLGAEPVSVYCESWNPAWSWYAGDANAAAVFEMSNGARYTFTGSWCAPGRETSWNGAWRVSGAEGSATWDGDHAPELDGTGAPSSAVDPGEGIAGSLAAFVSYLQAGTPLWGEVHDNVLSLAMVEAAVLSASSGRRVQLDEVLEGALAKALADEAREDVAARLKSWSSVREALTR